MVKKTHKSPADQSKTLFQVSGPWLWAHWSFLSLVFPQVFFSVLLLDSHHPQGLPRDLVCTPATGSATEACSRLVSSRYLPLSSAPSVTAELFLPFSLQPFKVQSKCPIKFTVTASWSSLPLASGWFRTTCLWPQASLPLASQSSSWLESFQFWL